MGQLTDLGFATDIVKLAGGKELVVRGISPDDILRIARIHADAFTKLFDKFAGGELDSLELEDTGKIAQSLAQDAPTVVADIIAYAADDPEGRAVALRLPFSVQVEALRKIALLTFATEGGVKKVLETLLEMAAVVGGLMTELRQQQSGSLVSEGK